MLVAAASWGDFAYQVLAGVTALLVGVSTRWAYDGLLRWIRRKRRRSV